MSTVLSDVAPLVGPAGVVLRSALMRGSDGDVMTLLKSMNAKGVADVLREVGFVVDPALIDRGRSAVFESAKSDLCDALELCVDGFGLQIARDAALAVSKMGGGPSFAAKGAFTEVALEFDPVNFAGDAEAARVIQGIMRSSAISVSLLGDALPRERGSLLLVAGQALTKGVQGFGFDGIAGKYEVPLSMAQVHALNQDSAQAVAEESARAGLSVWAAGDKVESLNDWVLDSIQRLLHGSVSLESAQAVVQSIESGALGRHAAEIGAHQSTALFAGQGLDISALTVEEQAKGLGLVVQAPDRLRGQYFGPVMAKDHRAVMIKSSRMDLVELPYAALAVGQARPKLGDSVRLSFKNNTLTVGVVERGAQSGGVGR